ncbi:acyltransferase [Ideonella livida]|uniref:Acyltransferase n=1 Tax=Ideonella livida TaxID=2707176 RepID=A0A7C9PK05_9BURK|nr:acyltransferase [Ideonella livida]NDY93936.1 acyltransferase [Ideonella livida]
MLPALAHPAHRADIAACIEGFDPLPAAALDARQAPLPQLQVSHGGQAGPGPNRVLHHGLPADTQVSVRFEGGCTGAAVVLGPGLRGQLAVQVWGHDSLIHLGRDCTLKQTEIRSFQHHDLVVVGREVNTTGPNTWISGNHAGAGRPALIIGDDTMFSYDVVLRNTDAHPILSLADDQHLNVPRHGIVIEPHVWVGERVVILKDVRVGACSVLALGALVTRDVPRCALARGAPARAEARPGQYWARTFDPADLAKARAWMARYGG